ncbi:aminotransferase class V-fold PLP-dependent enzyme [Streptosporangium canum]|nr:aminotransferase class V-fold PLP-dependent enzyme [Streptosporangium canum]
MTAAMTGEPVAWAVFEQTLEQARAAFAQLVHAPMDNVAVLPNASVAAFQVASTRDLSARPRIMALPGEFPSLGQVWQAQRSRGADVTRLPDLTCTELAAPCAERMDEDVALVCLASVNYLDSARRPVAEVVKAAHQAGAQVLVDAYQSAGVEPIDVDELGCDFLLAGTSKYLLGLPGVAFLYVREPERGLPPSLTGWFGRPPTDRFDPRSTAPAPGAARFETGTPAVPSVYAALAGLRLLERLDLAAVRRHVEDLTAFGHALLTDLGLEVVGPARAAERGAHLAVAVPDPLATAARLAERGVVVSVRAHVVRLACHYFTTEEDLRRAGRALAALAT